MDSIDQREEFKGEFIFYRRKEKVPKLVRIQSMLEIQRNIAHQPDLEGRGKKREGERQNKQRGEAEPWSGLFAFFSQQN